MTHATFAPSAAHRWLVCAGSVRASMDAPPSPPSAYAAEGIRMHEFAARCLVELLNPIDHAPEDLAPDAVEAVALYVGFIRQRIDLSRWFAIEQSVRYSDALFGTADYLGITTDRVLDVIDFKGGAGVLVAVEDNPQMLTYAWLAWQDTTVLPDRNVDRVRMTIVQPRAPNGPVRTAEFSVVELVSWGLKLKRAMRAAEQPGAPLKPGEHCRWCPAAITCPALKEEMRTVEIDPRDVPPDVLANLLDACERAEIRLTAIRDYAKQSLTNGGRIPGWILRPTRAVRKWINERNAEVRLRTLGVEPFEQKLISVAVADKALKERFAELSGLWSAESSGWTLARGDEPDLKDKGEVIEKALK